MPRLWHNAVFDLRRRTTDWSRGVRRNTRPPAGAEEAVTDDPALIPPDTAGDAQADGTSEDPEPPPPAAEAEEQHSDETDRSAAEAPAKAKPRKVRRDPALIRAFRTGLPVEGRVEKVIKGGYEVKVGRGRGFCPHSQIDLHRVDDPEHRVGQTYPFKILQLRRGGEEVILSRRALLEEERTEEAKAVRATLIEEQVTRGRVARTADFGVFVDLGAGVMGLVHISEVSHSRVQHADEVVKPGDWVSVKVLKLQEESGRISLSIRQAQDDPWSGVGERFQSGGVYPGEVKRLTDFGAFVEFEGGVEALAPGREFPPVPGGWQAGLDPGVRRNWVVLSVDPGRRRMSVAPAPAEGGPTAPLELQEGMRVRGRVQKVERFGVFVWLAPGQVGLLPNALTGTPRGTSLEREFPVGKEIELDVLDLEDGGRKIRLAVPGAAEAGGAAAGRDGAYRGREGREPRDRRASRAEREDRGRTEHRDPAAQESVTGFGTNLGDALRAAFEKKREER
jgi:small subunit ribosomal protein S1